MLAAKDNHLSLIPRTHVMGGESQLLQGVVWPPHEWYEMYEVGGTSPRSQDLVQQEGCILPHEAHSQVAACSACPQTACRRWPRESHPCHHRSPWVECW